MSRGTSNLLTIWTPFGENPLEMGALACVESSNQLPRLHHFQVHYIDMIGLLNTITNAFWERLRVKLEGLFIYPTRHVGWPSG